MSEFCYQIPVDEYENMIVNLNTGEMLSSRDDTYLMKRAAYRGIIETDPQNFEEVSNIVSALITQRGRLFELEEQLKGIAHISLNRHQHVDGTDDYSSILFISEDVHQKEQVRLYNLLTDTNVEIFSPEHLTTIKEARDVLKLYIAPQPKLSEIMNPNTTLYEDEFIDNPNTILSEDDLRSTEQHYLLDSLLLELHDLPIEKRFSIVQNRRALKLFTGSILKQYKDAEQERRLFNIRIKNELQRVGAFLTQEPKK